MYQFDFSSLLFCSWNIHRLELADLIATREKLKSQRYESALECDAFENEFLIEDLYR